MLGDASTPEAVGASLAIRDIDEACWVGQFAHIERELTHLLLATFILCRDGESDSILAYLRRYSHIIATVLVGERSVVHGEANLVGRNARHTDTDGVLIARIEHVHHGGTHRCRWLHHRVGLRELATNGLAITVLHHKVTFEGEVACGATNGLIASILRLQEGVAHINLRALCGIDSRHNDLSGEFSTTHNCLCAWNHQCLNFVHTHILHVDVGNQLMKHLAFSMTHICLELREQCDSSCHGGVLEHILLPVLALQFGFLRHICRKVGTDYLLLSLIVNHGGDAFTIGLYRLLQLTAFAHTRCEHDMGGSFEVVTSFYVIDVCIAAISFTHNLPLQVLSKRVERVGHLANLLSFLIPLACLLRILLHGILQLLVNRLVLCGRVCFGAIQTFVHELEAFEHIG